MDENPDTEELRAIQGQREAVEAERASSAPDEAESAQHRRRAEKARYLRHKLDERAESEREQD